MQHMQSFTDDDDAPIKIESYADMANRPRFVSNVDPKLFKLKKILTEYHLSGLKIECSLPDRTPHWHGLLVEAEDEKGTCIETCIGADCGAREFPDQYDVARKSFIVRRARVAHLDAIDEYLRRVQDYSREIDTIWYAEKGGRWADRCRELYNSACPESVRQHVTRTSRSGSWTLKLQVQIKEEERENDIRLGYRRSQVYEERVIGALRGGPALLRSVSSVLKPLRDGMTEYAKCDPLGMTSPARRKWVEWSKTIPARLDEARTLVTLARELYSTSNLEQLIQLARWKDEKRAVRDFILGVDSIELRQQAKAS
jgi:hypothetical protein